jgi:hypothetical protein
LILADHNSFFPPRLRRSAGRCVDGNADADDAGAPARVDFFNPDVESVKVGPKIDFGRARSYDAALRRRTELT